MAGTFRAFIARNPVVVNSVIYGTLFASGELTQQTIQGRERYDWAQIGRLGFAGAVIFGPAYTIWYRRLDHFIPGNHKKAVVQKIVMDQSIMGLLGGATFFGSISALEGKSAKECKDEVVSKLPRAYITGWVFWPIMQFINFSFLPTSMRAPYVACCAFVWTNFMCYLKSQTISDAEPVTESLSQGNPQVQA